TSAGGLAAHSPLAMQALATSASTATSAASGATRRPPRRRLAAPPRPPLGSAILGTSTSLLPSCMVAPLDPTQCSAGRYPFTDLRVGGQGSEAYQRPRPPRSVTPPVEVTSAPPMGAPNGTSAGFAL